MNWAQTHQGRPPLEWWINPKLFQNVWLKLQKLKPKAQPREGQQNH
jgi:hypothetical protein